jgi:putative NADH-flavin reductase
MIIAVIAANGRSGQAFVEAALNRGHTVRAGIHGTNPFAEREGLIVMSCDATNKAEVLALIQGSTAVVSLIGHDAGQITELLY